MDKTLEVLDKIISDLEKKVSKIIIDDNEDIILSEEQKKIKKFLHEHGIRYLIHFTDAKNIPSIKENGILSIEQLKINKLNYLKNDTNRLDHELDYISLSISNINKYVYRNFRYNNNSIEHGVAIVINAEILYKEINNNRIYCETNAATANTRKGSNIEALYAMFDDKINYLLSNGEERVIDRKIEKRVLYETTDLQAEILWNKCVPSKYIAFYWDLEEEFFYGD